MRTRATVLHLDLDAFFAAVEQRDKPSLRGRPVVVGGTGPRGVVATASYEARRFGIGSAMPTRLARRRCPHAAYLAGRFEAYRRVSDVVMGLLRELSPLVEPVSSDEAYVDLAAAHPDVTAAAAHDLAVRLRAEVLSGTGVTASVGVGTSKLVAKIASDLRKPDALVVVAPGEEVGLLAPLPVRRLPGVGPVTQERLERQGLRTVGDVAAAELRELVGLLGRAHGTALHDAARGVDPRPVETGREARSVSAEETYPVDLTDRDQLVERLRALAGRVEQRLTSSGVLGRTVVLKVRRYDFSTLTRSVRTPSPVAGAADIAVAARDLLAAVDVADGVRLLGVGVTGLTGFAQQDLLAGVDLLGPDERGPAGPDVAGSARDVVEEVETGPEHTPGPGGWLPGQDVTHAVAGPGWVQGSGLGRVTVRHEGPRTPVGPVRTYRTDDPDLAPADPPVW